MPYPNPPVMASALSSSGSSSAPAPAPTSAPVPVPVPVPVPAHAPAPVPALPRAPGPASGPVTTFYLQRLPPELQLAIFDAALIKPSIHFFKAGFKWNATSTQWHIKYDQFRKAVDKSGYRYQEKLARVCPTAERAVNNSHTVPALIPFRRHPGRVDGAVDLLILKGFALYNRGGKDHLGFLPTRPGLPAPQPNMANYTALRRDFKDFRNIGLAVTRDILRGPGTGNPFRCRRAPVCTIPGTGHGEFGMCPREIAGFIDCCPNIEEFCLVYSSRTQPGTHTARQVQDWFRNRKSILFSLYQHMTNCIGIGPKSDALKVYHGCEQDFVEFHCPGDVNHRGAQFSGGTPCVCPLAPGCFPPGDVWTFNLFTLLAAVQTQLVDPANTFNLPLEKRQNLKLRVLLQELPRGGVWA